MQIIKNGMNYDFKIKIGNDYITVATLHPWLHGNKYNLYFYYYGMEYEKPKGAEETNNVSFTEIDTCNSTKDKSMIEDKLHILETLLKDFLANESMTTKETENIKEEDDEKETTLLFVQKNVNSNVIEEDIECYENMIDDCVRVDSEVYKQCKTALVALMAYACKNEKDMDFERWIQKYQKNSSGFSNDQKRNYTYMRNSFDSFLKRG